MTMNRAVRWIVGVVAATVLLLGVSAAAGVAQEPCTDPNYCPGSEPSGVVAPPPGSPPAPKGSPERALQLKRCKNKAKAKFGDNAVKKKAAIKKCKKKYG
jgi:hypothetical protein